MLKDIKKYQDFILAAIAFIFIVSVIWTYFWGINMLLVNLNKAVVIERTEEADVQFDLGEAKKILEERNLVAE